MATVAELVQQHRAEEAWAKCCGFIDLSIEECMQVQRRLLMEQLMLMSRCELGRRIMGEHVPQDVDDFRRSVPLTTYDDYLPFLAQKREDVLPRPVYRWACTSGRSAEFEPKWVPYTKEAFDKMGLSFFGGIILKLGGKRGQVPLREEDVMLQALAPPPYATGAITLPSILEQFPMRAIPPMYGAEEKGFQERLEEGFRLALREGIDILIAIPSVLVRLGEQFEQQAGAVDVSSLLHPKVIARVLRGWLRAKAAGRPMLPKDLWSVRLVATAGTDASVFRKRIEYYWGRPPGEAYGCTEGGVIAMETGGNDLTFIPDSNFFEFLPEEEHLKSKEDPTHIPKTVLLDEVEAGAIYELVITSFHGGPFLRYRLADLIAITALRDKEQGVDIPQMAFYGRADDIIDLSGFARLTEKAIGIALEDAGLRYVDWTARKEVERERPLVRLYVELGPGEVRSADEIREVVDESLKELDPNYRDIEHMLGWKPLEVTVLSPGTFQRFILQKQAEGAELAHLKPPHMQPSDKILSQLLQFSQSP